jgi:hypothetical protein
MDATPSDRPATGLLERVDKRTKAILSWATDYLKQATILLSAFAALIGAVVLLKLPGVSGLVISAIVLALPLAVLATTILVGRLEKARVTRVLTLPPQRPTDYFQIGPREDTPEDRRGFSRPDDRQVEIFNWLMATDEPVMVLTGRSGTGKSSLLAAYVIPRSREANPAVRALVVRAYEDPIRQLRQALLESDLFPADSPGRRTTAKIRTILERACDFLRGKGERLLVIFEQFEELVIIHDQEPKRVEAMRDLLGDLRSKRIDGLTLLLSIRSDYIGVLHRLGVPALVEARNWKDVTPFTEPDAGRFLRGGFQELAPNRLNGIISELRTIEGTPGLIRPIVLNMAGLILERQAGPHSLRSDPGALLAGYVRSCVERSDVRDHAPKILEQMLTEAGTKQPRSVADLTAACKLDDSTVEGYLTQMIPFGLVRRITRPDQVQERVWEVSHDFVARLLQNVLHNRRPTPWQRLRPWLTLAALMFWFVTIFGVIPFELRRQREQADVNEAIGALVERSWLIDNRIDDRGRYVSAVFAPYADFSFDVYEDERVHSEREQRRREFKDLKEIVPYLKKLATRGPIWLNLRGTTVSDLGPLEGTRFLTRLDIRGIPAQRLAPLKGMPLESLLLRVPLVRGSVVTDEMSTTLSSLRSLRFLSIQGFNVMDLTPLQDLPLEALNLAEMMDPQCKRVVDLKPLVRLSRLEYLNLSNTNGVLSGAQEPVDLSPLLDIRSLKRLVVFQMGASSPDVLRELRDRGVLVKGP